MGGDENGGKSKWREEKLRIGPGVTKIENWGGCYKNLG